MVKSRLTFDTREPLMIAKEAELVSVATPLNRTITDTITIPEETEKS